MSAQEATVLQENPPSPQQLEELDELDTGHDYDGIREHDNRLPNWWLAVLFITIIFGYGYWVYYEMLDGPDQWATYDAKMSEMAELAAQRAKERGALTDDALIALSEDSAKVSSGSSAYDQFCLACHGAQGEGSIGPNLTDKYWLHGSSPTDIYSVVASGVPAKGMPAWEGVLGPERTEEVVAFLLTLKGKNLEGRPPEGEPVEE